MKLKQLLGFILYTLLLGFLGSTFVNTDMYNSLIKPEFSPPSYVFAIVWTILYIIMGISLYLIYNSKSGNKKDAILFYMLQLFVNVTWPILFFRLELIYIAFIWLVILFILVLTSTIKFSKIDKRVALLQIPYILWLIFAGILNLNIYMLNS